MPFFSKPVSQLTFADLRELLDGSAAENIRLEFKREAPARNEMMKKISSFANTYGGWIIVGAAESADDHGIIQSLPGVAEIPSYKQTLVQWSFDAIGPPIDIQVSESIPVEGAPGKVVYVVFVPESDLAPHFLNGRKGIYVRTDEFSQHFKPRMATLDEILRLSARRKIITDRRLALLERAKRRFRSFADHLYEGRGRNPHGLGATLSLVISPRYPDRKLFEYVDLLDTVRGQRVNWRQVNFPDPGNGEVSQHESILVLRPGSSFSLLEVSLWGLISYSVEIEIGIGPPTHGGDDLNQQVGIHLNHMVGYLLVFMEHARRVLMACGYQGNLVANLELNSIRDVPWLHFPDGIAEEGARSTLDDSAVLDFDLTASGLITSRDDVVRDFLREIFFAMNWAIAASTDAQLDELLAAGYAYNFWPSR